MNRMKYFIWFYFWAPVRRLSLKNIVVLKVNKVKYKRLKIRGNISIVNKGTIIIDSDVNINSSKKSNSLGYSMTGIEVFEGAELRIGKNVGISNAVIRCEKKIIIEDNVLIGGGVTIIDSDSHSLNWETRFFSPLEDIISSPIRIKKGAFIGTGSIILKGVTIGEHAVIGAGAVVTCDVPNDEIWAGNPAHFIKKIPAKEI